MSKKTNPSLFLQTAPDALPPYFPPPLRAQWIKDAAPVFALPVLWLRHQATGLIHAWELSRDDLALVQAARDDGIAGFNDGALRRLECLGAAFEEAENARQIAEFGRAIDDCQDSLRRRGYAVLRNLMLPGYHLQIRSYFERIKDRLKIGDSQVPRRNAKHNDILCRLFHVGLNDAIARICEESIKPSYCYLGIYQPGAVLTRHIDRPQCRWNVSLLLDSMPEASPNDGWPIHVECPNDAVAQAVAGIGDAVIYNGTRIPHWREEMPARYQYQSLCFFHFVAAEFAGRLN